MKKIPIGIQDFKKLIEEGYYYVDKTEILHNLITSNNYYFMSRPRRFGKSLTLSTLKYIFLGEKELFKNTWIYDKWSFETNPVVYLSFAGFSKDMNLEEYIIENLEIYIEGEIIKEKELGNFFLKKLLEKIYKQTGKQCVILIDEYDKPVLEYLKDISKAEEIRIFFRTFYAPIKDNDKYIELFFLTGLTKLLKMSIFSVLNNLSDITIDPNYYKILGYTEKEIFTFFKDDINEINDENIVEKLKLTYNGYNFGNKEDTVYNPRNINKFMINKEIRYYRADTGVPSGVVEYVDMYPEKVLELQENIKTGELFITETDLVLDNIKDIKAEIIFYNAGYLTSKKTEGRMLYLGFPNKETEDVVLNYFFKLINSQSYNQVLLNKVANNITNGILKQDNEILSEGLNDMIYKLLSAIAYEWINNNPEGWFKSFLGLCLRLNTVYYYPELEGINGRADLVIPHGNNVYIIEAKVDKSIEEAIKQIDKQYIPQMNQFNFKNIYKIGINWDRKEKIVEVKYLQHDFIS